ncbi:MAG: hypothetical protein AAF206_08995 [Bacteroidota bacterium]
MDLSRLPFIPLNHFFRQMDRLQQRLFLALLVLLVFSAVNTLFHYQELYCWSLEIREVPETINETVNINRLEKDYRSFDLSLDAFRQYVRYTAGPLKPAAIPLYVFFLVQVIAWSYLLAAATYIRSRWVYGVYLLFALFLFFTDVAGMMFGGDPFFIARILLIAVFLGLAYAFQMHRLRWSMSMRLLSILCLNLLCFGLVVFRQGWLALHQMSVNTLPYLAVIASLFVFFVAKEPTNFIMAGATNRPDIRSRLHPSLIGLIMLVWLILTFSWFDEYMQWELLPWFRLDFLRPTHIIVASGLLAVMLSQNHYTQLREIFSSQNTYSLLLTAWGVISLSFFAAHLADGDVVFQFNLDRWGAVTLFPIGVGHVFFIFYNHRALISRKINLYFLMQQGPRVPFFSVWLFGLAGLVVTEGSEAYKHVRLYQHHFFNQFADHALLENNLPLAIRGYETALLSSPTSVRANYNLAALTVGDPEQVQLAIERYRQASAFFDFPFARINAASLLALRGRKAEAKAQLQPRLNQRYGAYQANNLAMLYLQDAQPDSAILSFQKALLNDLSLSSVYSNLAQLYLDHDRPAQADSFFRAAVSQDPSPAAAVNGLFHLLSTGADMPVFETEKYLSDPAYAYNLALLGMRDSSYQLDAATLKRIVGENLNFAAMIPDAYRQFKADSIEYAVSRIRAIPPSSPGLRAQGFMMLGQVFFAEGIPEMAQKYFAQAGEEGLGEGKLAAAQLLIDLGQKDSAASALSLIRVEHTELWDECSKELAMLLTAFGQDVYAATEYDISQLSFDEMVRIGLYADSMNQFINTLEAFRRVQAMDSNSHVPYLELSRIYNRYADSLAVTNLEYGLDNTDDNDEALQLELVRAYYLQGQMETGETLLASIQTESPEKWALQADIALAKQDTAASIGFLQQRLEKEPHHVASILQLAGLLKASGEADASNQLILSALEINTENADLWYAYAKFSRDWGLGEDAGFGAVRAMQLTLDPEKQAQIAAEFADEIRLISDSTTGN